MEIEYRRTCDRDGVSWYVTEGERKPAGKLERGAVGLLKLGNALSLRKPQAGIELAEQGIAGRDAKDRCPVCGSGQFTEQRA